MSVLNPGEMAKAEQDYAAIKHDADEFIKLWSKTWPVYSDGLTKAGEEVNDMVMVAMLLVSVLRTIQNWDQVWVAGLIAELVHREVKRRAEAAANE